jgi:hypothetical protein
MLQGLRGATLSSVCAPGAVVTLAAPVVPEPEAPLAPDPLSPDVPDVVVLAAVVDVVGAAVVEVEEVPEPGVFVALL